MGKIVSVNVSKKRGTIKKPVSEIELVAGQGVRGDAHSAPGDRQVRPELTRRFHRLIEQAVAQDLISPSKATDLLGKPLIEVRREMEWPEEAKAV